MRLPAELYPLLLSHLDCADIAAIAQCSKTHYDLAIPVLYSGLFIHLRSGDPDYPTTSLLQTLSGRSHLRYFIRRVEVYNVSSTYWTAGPSKLLGVILSTILTCPDRIRSFSWRTNALHTSVFFPNLEDIECTRIQHFSEMLWVKWHLQYCRCLRSVRLRLSGRVSWQAGAWLFADVSLPRVQQLCVQGVDLCTVDTDTIGLLKVLDLKFCENLRGFFARLISSGIPNSLRSLKITGDIDMPSLRQFLAVIAKSVLLEELALRIGGVHTTMSTKHFVSHAPRLSSLVLDFRRDISDPRTSVRYAVSDFETIIKDFPMLKAVGLAVDLKNPRYSRYHRTKLQVSRRNELPCVTCTH